MRVRIHRGSHEIGGNCVELAAADGPRLLLDLGRPLSASWNDDVALPDVPGLRDQDATLLGLVISHPHLDHYGLAAQVEVDLPIYIGREAAALLEAAAFFSPVSGRLEATAHLRHREPFTIGPFHLTPYLNDHSAFDAYSLLIEVDGKRLFYTGDIRGHGRKASLFHELVRNPPASVDVLLMEGTHVRTDTHHDDAAFLTETDLEQRFVALCKETAGAVVVFGSAQNLDRLVTVYRAAKRSTRTLVIDLYGATVAAATRETIPQPGFHNLRVYVPWRQRVRVKEAAEFWRVDEVKPVRVFEEELAAEPGKWLFHLPSSTAKELVDRSVLEASGLAVWSLWDGYLTEPSGKRLRTLLADHGIGLEHVHTSGHAAVAQLRELVDAMAPARVVPIHSEAGQRYDELFPRVEPHSDGEWWQV